NGNGTFFNACACSVALDQRNKTRGRIIGSLRIALRSGGQNGNSREPFISNPFTCGRSPVYYTRPSGVNEPRHFTGELSTPHLTKNGSRLSVEALRMGGELTNKVTMWYDLGTRRFIMPILKLKDADIYYEVHGNGPPFLFFSETACDGEVWKIYQVPEF